MKLTIAGFNKDDHIFSVVKEVTVGHLLRISHEVGCFHIEELPDGSYKLFCGSKITVHDEDE